MQFFGVDGYEISSTTACKDPVRAIKFLDWLASDEGQVLRNWGIEGKHYQVGNGTRVIPADILDKNVNDAALFRKKRGSISMRPLLRVTETVLRTLPAITYTTNFPEQIIASYSDTEKETRDHAKTCEGICSQAKRNSLSRSGARCTTCRFRRTEITR